MKKIYSFDVFDTLITRCYSEPVDLFHSVANTLIRKNMIQTTAAEWVQVRISAELEARSASNTEEITLSEIYQRICQVLKLPEKFQTILEEVEIDLELSSLKCIRPHVNKVKSLRDNGYKVVFISDMYLPSYVIKKALAINNIGCQDDELFVSSEYKETKHTGSLFRRVLNHFNITPSELTHTGDNVISDYQTPKSLGINAIHYSSFGNVGREQLINANEQLPITFRSLIAGTIRLSRLNGIHLDERSSHIHNISVTVIAPILFGFTLWSLLEAKKKGLTTLHFISRDGQILKHIADKINSVLQLNVDCKYFYGSRQAFHLPATTKNNWDQLDWLYDNTSFFSVRLVFGRVELKPDSMENYLSENGFNQSIWDRNLDARERQQLRHLLQNSPEFKNLVLEQAELARRTLLSYLDQEGINAAAKVGFVDIGWNGRLQRSISRVMDAANIRPADGLNGFYFGLCQRLKAFENDKLFAWYYDEEKQLNRFNNVVILEKFVEATHGSVVGYKQDEKGVKPIFKEEKNQEALSWGLTVQQASILDFTDLLCSSLQNVDEHELANTHNWTYMTEILLADFCKKPSLLDAQIFGSVSISEDQNHARSYPLAKPLTLQNCISLLMRRKPDVYNDLWIDGSLHLTRGGNLIAGCLKIQNTLIGYLKSKISS